MCKSRPRKEENQSHKKADFVHASFLILFCLVLSNYTTAIAAGPCLFKLNAPDLLLFPLLLSFSLFLFGFTQSPGKETTFCACCLPLATDKSLLHRTCINVDILSGYANFILNIMSSRKNIISTYTTVKKII